MTGEIEKQNVSMIVEIYVRANRFKEGCESQFLPLVCPADVGRSCFVYGKLLYLLKKFAPTIWEEYFKYFVKLEFADDFEKQLEFTEGSEHQRDIKWSNILQLWGYALDIENNLIDGGDLDESFRQSLVSLRKNEEWTPQVYESESRELAKWNRNASNWLEYFYKRSCCILGRVINSLDKFLNGVDVNENPTARLALIEQFLLETEYNFFRNAQAIGPYMPSEDYPPNYWNDGMVDIDLGSKPGTLRAEIIGGRKIRCSFSPDGKNSKPIEWILEGGDEVCGYGREDYKREVFETWNYTTGKFLGRWQTDKRAFWFLDCDPEFKSYIEHVIELSLPLFKNKDYKELARNIIKTVTNDQPEWWPGEVQWSYVAELDRMIQECRLARNIYNQVNDEIPFVSIESNKIFKPAIQIPAEFKSAPMSLKELAGCFGQGTNASKIRTMMRIGSIKFEMINRQSYFFDLRTLPQYVQDKIKERIS